jgi:hypothetical protein
VRKGDGEVGEVYVGLDIVRSGESWLCLAGNARVNCK